MRRVATRLSAKWSVWVSRVGPTSSYGYTFAVANSLPHQLIVGIATVRVKLSEASLRCLMSTSRAALFGDVLNRSGSASPSAVMFEPLTGSSVSHRGRFLTPVNGPGRAHRLRAP
jgi:hypothetical protein